MNVGLLFFSLFLFCRDHRPDDVKVLIILHLLDRFLPQLPHPHLLDPPPLAECGSRG
jgi:hypothetical protein